jgi:phosphoglycolate phosphatase
MPRSRPTLLFDFDGTIADTMRTLIDIYNSVIAPAYGCKPIPAQREDELRGVHPRDVMRDFGVTLVKLPLMVLRARGELAKRIDSIRPHQGVPDALRRIRERGCTMGLLTSNSRTNVARFLANHHLSDTFDFIYTGKHAFGKHRILRRIARERRLAAAEIVFVGDETRDIEAARTAGIRVAAVTWGYNNRHALERLKPDWCFDNPLDLGTLTDRIV